MISTNKMKKISSVEYQDKSFNVFYVDNDIRKEAIGEHHITCCYTNHGIIVVFDEFYKLSDNAKAFMIYHELAHILGHESDIDADLFAISQTSRHHFSVAINECQRVLTELHPHKKYEVQKMISDKVKNVAAVLLRQ